MSLARVLRFFLAVAALASLAAGASGGRAATLALTRAVAVTGQSVAEFQPETNNPALVIPDANTLRKK